MQASFPRQKRSWSPSCRGPSPISDFHRDPSSRARVSRSRKLQTCRPSSARLRKTRDRDDALRVVTLLGGFFATECHPSHDQGITGRIDKSRWVFAIACHAHGRQLPVARRVAEAAAVLRLRAHLHHSWSRRPSRQGRPPSYPLQWRSG